VVSKWRNIVFVEHITDIFREIEEAKGTSDKCLALIIFEGKFRSQDLLVLLLRVQVLVFQPIRLILTDETFKIEREIAAFRVLNLRFRDSDYRLCVPSPLWL
jgi:hypothetical protein